MLHEREKYLFGRASSLQTLHNVERLFRQRAKVEYDHNRPWEHLESRADEMESLRKAEEIPLAFNVEGTCLTSF